MPSSSSITVSPCPGFGWDRVDFHKKPGGDTAGPADPNWPNKWSTWYHVTSCLVPSGRAGWGEVNYPSGARWASGGEREFLHVVPSVFCIFLPVLLLSLFASFAFLLNCPCPNQRVLPFSSHSPPHPTRGKGNRVATWSFVADCHDLAPASSSTAFGVVMLFLVWY